MNNFDKKRQLLIASDQFINRLGIKTLLSVIGVESDLRETHNIESVKSIMNSGQHFDYLIISDSILSSPRNESILELRDYCPKCKFMIMGDTIVQDCLCEQFVLNSYSQKLVLQKFQDFFFETESDSDDPDASILSEREIEVLKAIALGLPNKLVADKLFISVHTVITHRKNITSKLGIKSVAGLTVYALLNNIIRADQVK